MAGEEIDATLGVKLGFSTLASAGLGNLVSDVAGIGFADQLEVAAAHIMYMMHANGSDHCCLDSSRQAIAAVC